MVVNIGMVLKVRINLVHLILFVDGFTLGLLRPETRWSSILARQRRLAAGARASSTCCCPTRKFNFCRRPQRRPISCTPALRPSELF